MANNLEEMSKKLKDNRANELAGAITEIHNAVVVNTELSKLPEAVFKEFFLEFFINGGIGDTTSPLAIKWIELAGSPFAAVEVIDDNTNNVLFTVPGMLVYPDTDENINTISFSDITASYRLKANRLQSEANNYLENKLNTVNNLISNKNIEEATRQWKLIFEYYGHGPQTNTTIATPQDDYIIYD